jgi:ABC-2 type transport system permease protein
MTDVPLLARHYLRRDRWGLLWWTLGVTVLYWSQAVSVDQLYVTQEDFNKAAASMEGNAAFIAMAGPARALNTIGGQVTWQAATFGAIVAGLMSMFLVGRHTRAEEESGRDELLRAAPVRRFAPTTAALVTAALANVLLGVGVTVSLIAYPLAVADSVALGLGLTLCGWFFTGVALLAAQLTSTTRAAYGITGIVIALAYGLRAIGDVSRPWLSWLSPIGWYQAMHPFSGVRWWPTLLLVTATVVLVWAAYAVFDRRDFGAGVLPDRPGPAHAAADLHRGWRLSWRMQKGSVIGWSLGLFLSGLAYGAIGNDVESLVGDSHTTQDLFVQAGGDLVRGFYATAILMLALLACGFAISSALRPRGEEDGGRIEALLATALGRRQWLLGHGVVTVVGSLFVVTAAGLGLGLGFAMVTGEQSAIGRYLLDTLAYAAPVLLLGTLTLLLYGVYARLASLAWVLLGFCVVVMMFGEVLRLPQWLQDLSPFEHLALVPAEDFRWLPVATLLALAAAVAVAAFEAFARRDLH